MGSLADRRAHADRRSRAIDPGWLFAALAITWLAGGALAGRDMFAFRDMLHNFAPLKALFWKWPPPLWNDHAFSGSSWLVDLNQQPFYLPNLAFAFVSAPVVPGVAAYLWLHVLFGAWACHALCKRVAPAGAAVGATVFALCGFSLANFSNPQWACAASWAPAVLLAFISWGERGGPCRAALVALSAPQVLLAGDPPLFALLLVAGGCLAFSRRRVPPAQLAFEGLGILTAAAILVLPQVVATLQAFPSLRRASGLPRDVREQWSLHPARIVELFVPRLLGPLFSEGFWGAFTVSPPWKGNYVHSIYAGAIGPGLLALGIRRRPRAAAPWALLAVTALLLACGRHFLHVYGLLGDVVPILNVFRYPQRLIALLMPAWAVLVALGASELPTLSGNGRGALVLGSVAAAAAALVAVAGFAPASNAASVQMSALHLGIVGAAALIVMRLPRGSAILGLALLFAVDLCGANGELLGVLPRSLFRGEPAVCAALAFASDGAPRSSFRVYVDQPASQPVEGDWSMQRVRDYHSGKRNVLDQCGFRQSVSLTSLDPSPESELWSAVGPLRVLRGLSTRFAVTAPGRSVLLDSREVVRNDRWDFAVSELSDVVPPVFRPARVLRIAPSAFAAAARSDPALLGSSVAALETTPREHVADPEARLLAIEHAPSRTAFRIAQRRPGYWVETATFDRDWRASVDGAPARIERSDLFRRAIWVPAGEHLVEMEYRPVLPLALLALSGALSIALALAALWHPAATLRVRCRIRSGERWTGFLP